MKLEIFLYRINQIHNEQLIYGKNHDGSDGYCDCVGEIIGATRRAGEDYTGIHGSNFFARRMVTNFRKITSEKALKKGDIVFKAKEPGEDGYDLPARYKPGGKYYNGDLRDYYHIGTVTGVNPLRITHMTTPTSTVDTELRKWKYTGEYLLIDGVTGKPGTSGAGSEKPGQSGTSGTSGTGSASGKTETGGSSGKGGIKMYYATASGGNADKPVNMRASKNTSAALVEEIPQGSTVIVMDDGGEWCKVKYNGRTGYVMTKFLRKQATESTGSTGETEQKVTLELTYSQAVALLPILDSFAGQLAGKVGRG